MMASVLPGVQHTIVVVVVVDSFRIGRLQSQEIYLSIFSKKQHALHQIWFSTHGFEYLNISP